MSIAVQAARREGSSTHEIGIACPWCGAALVPAREARADGVTCRGCSRPFTCVENVGSWNEPAAPATRRPNLRTLALRQLNPLSSRLSPLRYFSDWRVEQYYRRTIADQALARDWGQHHLRELDVQPGAPILDHGCGRGRHAALLAQLGFQVVGQDVRSHAWWGTLQNCFFQVVPSTAALLPWKDRAFALVLDVAVIHYLTHDRLVSLAAEVFRVLAPGGHWLLLEANDKGYGAVAPRRSIGRLYSLDSVREVVARAGFCEVDLTYEGFYAPMFPVFVNFVRKVARPGPVDLNDHGSTLAARIPAGRRACWRLRLLKPIGSD
jgi:SAM-dependent methyltransferase